MGLVDLKVAASNLYASIINQLEYLRGCDDRNCYIHAKYVGRMGYLVGQIIGQAEA
jgi:hypothetical protein